MELSGTSRFRVRFSIKIVVAEVSGFGFEPSRFIELAQGKPIFLSRELVFRDGNRSRITSVSPHC